MRVALCEVGPRDGLQNEDRVLSPEVRAELVRGLASSGLPRIEVASFVRDSLVPQMAGAEDVAALTADCSRDVIRSGLVLNERGYERLATSGLDEVHVAVVVTETFSRRNQNASVEEALAAAARITERARGDGLRSSVTLSAAFGCPFEGPVDPSYVLGLAEKVAGYGPDELMLADTIGVAVPSEVKRLTASVSRLGLPVGVHLHDTRHTGVANALAALEGGATVLDAAVGGIGGCPFAPRATGNVATDDLVYVLEREGIHTGVDLEEVCATALWLEGVLGKQLPGRVYRAGDWPVLPSDIATS